MMLLPGCLGAGEGIGLPLYQLSSPETPQPGGRAGQAGDGSNQQEGADPREEQSRICGLLKVISKITISVIDNYPSDSYQLVESITFSQVMLDSVFYSVDIEMKKKQLLHQLGDLKLSPAVDDKVRKQIKDIKEFLGKDQVEILHQVKELKDPEKLSVILQFIQLIHAGDNQRNMAGINQFVSFLSEKEERKM